MRLKFKKAQGATEYAIFIAAVLAGLLALQVYYNRAVKGNVKARADSVGEQFNMKDGKYVYETRSAGARRNLQGSATSDVNRTSISTITGAGGISANFTTELSASGVGSQISGTYYGGEVTSSKYVDEFDSASTGFGSNASLGKVQSNRTVWEDSGLQ